MVRFAVCLAVVCLIAVPALGQGTNEQLESPRLAERGQVDTFLPSINLFSPPVTVHVDK
jgi:hypothetical protein